MIYVPASVTDLGSWSIDGQTLTKAFRFLFGASAPADGGVPEGWALDPLPTGEFAAIEWGAAKPAPEAPPAAIAPAA